MEKKSPDYHNSSTVIQLEGNLEYITTDTIESISSICDPRSPTYDANAKLDLDLPNRYNFQPILTLIYQIAITYVLVLLNAQYIVMYDVM